MSGRWESEDKNYVLLVAGLNEDIISVANFEAKKLYTFESDEPINVLFYTSAINFNGQTLYNENENLRIVFDDNRIYVQRKALATDDREIVSDDGWIDLSEEVFIAYDENADDELESSLIYEVLEIIQ